MLDTLIGNLGKSFTVKDVLKLKDQLSTHAKHLFTSST